MSSALAVLPRASARVLSARVALGAIVLAGTGLLTALTRQVVTPSVFPDEYLYSQLGRSLATTGHLRVRGVDAHFLPVLQPLLTAPLWLVHDVGTAFHLIQLENAFVMSLAALPAYWIARRLGVSTGLSLAVAALTVSGPPLLFSGMLMAESFAYPLTLTVVAAAVYALERPSLRAQVVLLALSGVAAFDRLQLAALPICAAAAVVLMGLRERRLRPALREQALLVGSVCAGFTAAVAYVAVRGLGYYHLAPRPVAAPQAVALAGLSGYVVLLAAGMAVAPSGIVGLVTAIGRPRRRAELAFGFLTALVTGAF